MCLLLQVTNALEVVHAAGILHRDLKPGNILLDEAECPYLADFGLARLADDGEPLPLSGAIMGTPAYMAPEQASAEFGQVSVRSDLYSIGVVLGETAGTDSGHAETPPSATPASPEAPLSVQLRALDRIVDQAAAR